MTLLHSLSRYKQRLALAAQAVEEASLFDQGLAVGLVMHGQASVTTLSGLGGQLRASAALSSPELKRFLLLRSEHGFDHAFALCSSEGEEGAGFCRAWDEVQADLANGALASIDDLVAMVCKARSGWQSDPRELLVVMVEGKRVEHALCPTAWFLR